MFLNIAALVFFGLCWGSTIPLLKFAVDAGHHPLGMMIWQLAVCVLVLGPFMISTGKRSGIAFGHIRYLFIICMIGTLIPNTFSLMATRHLPGGILAIIIATVPIISLSIALLARIESFSWRRFLGVILGVLSLVLVAVPDSTLPDPSQAPWVLVALLAPVCYASEGNFVAVRAPKQLSAVATLFGASVCGLVLLVPLVYSASWQVPVLTHWDDSRWAMICAGLGHTVAYTGYLWLLGRAGAVFTSQVAYVVTLTGVLGSVLFLGERYGALLWVAVVLMLAALALVKPLKKNPLREIASA